MTPAVDVTAEVFLFSETKEQEEISRLRLHGGLQDPSLEVSSEACNKQQLLHGTLFLW